MLGLPRRSPTFIVQESPKRMRQTRLDVFFVTHNTDLVGILQKQVLVDTTRHAQYATNDTVVQRRTGAGHARTDQTQM